LQGVVDILRLRQDALEQRIQKIGLGFRFCRQALNDKQQRRRQRTRNSIARLAPGTVFQVATRSTISPAGFGCFALPVLSSARFRAANRNLTPAAGRVEICDGGGPKPLIQNETLRGSRDRHLRPDLQRMTANLSHAIVCARD
jgi:hypothetical protein